MPPAMLLPDFYQTLLAEQCLSHERLPDLFTRSLILNIVEGYMVCIVYG